MRVFVCPPEVDCATNNNKYVMFALHIHYMSLFTLKLIITTTTTYVELICVYICTQNMEYINTVGIFEMVEG